MSGRADSTRSVVDATVAITIVMVSVVLAARGRQDAGAPAKVRILSPPENAYVSGSTRLRAVVEPSTGVSDVVFFVDGRQICAIARSPYECEWNAGTKIVEHQVRVVANLSGGGRVVSTLRTKGISFAESVEVDVVQITATVTDGHGHFIKDLSRSTFHVFEDGRPQTISHFSGDDSPLDLVVAIDTSNSMTPSLGQLKAAVKEFLAAIPTTDHITLLAFNSSIAVLTSRTTDLAERSDAVDQLMTSGTTVLYDAIVRGMDLLGTKGGRKAIVVFTDGEDEGSYAPIDEVERRLQASDVTLYMIGLGRGTSLEPLKQVMLRLAQPTGGRALFTDKIDRLKSAFHDLLDELSHQYLLGYESTNTRRDGTFRRIKVDADGHYQVRARQGYRAPTR